MSTFLPSSATTTVEIQALVYATYLTISAPSPVARDVPFTVSGKLVIYEGDLEIGLQNRSIGLSYNGISLGSVVTGSDGSYLASVSIPTVGIYTLTASYAGEEMFAASSATKGVNVGARAPPLSTIVPIVAPVVAGIVLLKTAG